MGRVSTALIKSLSEIVGSQNVHTQGERYEASSKDATEIVSRPQLAVTVTGAAQIPAILKLSHKFNLKIVARGAGTGLSGGSLATEDSIVLMLDKLDRIISIDADKRMAIVEPGVITQALADAAAAEGVFYPPDPASVAESTLGGNVAECAGGLRCKKYGVTKDYVLGLEGYLVSGELVQTGCLAENETYDLTSLLIGSEGTLLLITRIALQLIDPPEAQRTFLATFGRQRDAAEVVARLLALGVVPAVLEFMDGDAVVCSLDYLQLQREQFQPDLIAGLDADALLLIELDGSTRGIAADSVIVNEVVTRHAQLLFRMTNDDREREKLWKIRRSLSKAVTAAAPLRVSEDVCVPPSRFPALIGILPQLARDFELRVNSYGHAGDGNLHVNFLYPIDNEEGRALIAQAALELFKMTINLEGTISGEHGIGLAKREFLPLEVAPTAMELLRLVKRAFDPESRLNPDKIFRTKC
ncbi:MAG: FAD-linked oxidase C-terminal domain-containing protein [bacterium]